MGQVDHPANKPVVLITGISGNIGAALAGAFADDYTVVGLDRPGTQVPHECIAVDLTADDSVAEALREVKQRHGERIASIIHLAAYFDFTGEPHPLYEALNVQGTRRLLRGLQSFTVEQFIYPGTMLVHEPAQAGEWIDEDRPIAPQWAYPRSKAAAEAAIREEHGRIPYLVLRLAGLYDDRTVVPTLAHQIARIYERDFTSHLYAGEGRAGQSLVHKDDMVEAFTRAVQRRGQLPPEAAVLIGEPQAPGYELLQDRIGQLVHGEKNWTTLSLPRWMAKMGAAAQGAVEPLVPDAIDRGEKPFIRPFMMDLADDHYALDIERGRQLLGWAPRHRFLRTLPDIIRALKDDPAGWYRANGVTPPQWLTDAAQAGENPQGLRQRYEQHFSAEHRRNLWAHCCNLALALWLIVSAPMLGYTSTPLAWSEAAAGVVLLGFAGLSLFWRCAWARWACAMTGLWVLFAPLLFWTSNAAGYLNNTLIGMLIIGFAVLVRPPPGVSALAALSGPTVPPGWDYSPSSWTQRVFIIGLAWVGFHISRYLAAYQLGHIDGVWEPFFPGGAELKNGTEEIITSSVSEAWPVSDAGIGALTYALEILTGMIGSARRWRTMPWLVVLFGVMIVPLGVVSITFIIIQPIVIGTWCTLCLIAAVAMAVQIPYSVDELVATGQFLLRRRRAGKSLLRVFFTGDTDEGPPEPPQGDLQRRPWALVKEIVGGGVSLPWNLALCLLLGAWLMFSRLTVGAEGGLADVDHLVGALVITVTVTALAEIARPVRFLNVALGAVLIVAPWFAQAETAARLSDLLCGIALIGLSLRRGPVRHRYGN